MILGPDGKPVRPPRTFATPEWVMRSTLDRLKKDVIESKIADLRESVGVEPDTHMGDTITVRLPQRYR